MKMPKRNRRLALLLRQEGRATYRLIEQIRERYDCGESLLSEFRPDYPVHCRRLDKIIRVLKRLEGRGIL